MGLFVGGFELPPDSIGLWLGAAFDGLGVATPGVGLTVGLEEGEDVTGACDGLRLSDGLIVISMVKIGASVGNAGSSISVGDEVGASVLVHVPLTLVDQPGKHTQVHSSQSQVPLTQ